jgi:putative phosphoesterase
LNHHRQTLDVPSSGLRLAVVSDTHGNPHPDASRHLRALKPDHILHAGDVGNRAVLTTLEAIAPVWVVRGNIDERRPEWPDALTLRMQDSDGGALTVLMLHIGLRGTRLAKPARELAQRERAGLVICGHSHLPLLGRDHGIAILNPGSIGPRRFALPITFALLEVGPKGASMRHISCETGAEWVP